jgi:hypothetical protein
MAYIIPVKTAEVENFVVQEAFTWISPSVVPYKCYLVIAVFIEDDYGFRIND